MRAVIDLLSPRSFARAFALVVVGLSAANCSSDAVRLNDNPFATKTSANETTGSVPPGQIEARPLAEPQAGAQALPAPPPSGRLASLDPSAGIAGRPQLRAEPNQKQGWTWEGGVPVTIASGDTLASLSHRYGVPANAIAEANGLSGPAALQPGQRLVIPRYSASSAGSTAARIAAPASAGKLRAPMSSVHVVAPGDTLIKIAHRYKRPVAEIAAANHIAPHAMVKLGDRLVIPGKAGSETRTAAVAPAAESKPAPAAAPAAPSPALRQAEAPAPAAQKPAPAPQKLASIDPTPAVRVATPTTEIEAEEAPVNRNGELAFRWPVRGRVIANFGVKTNGQQNDGINLAVPEGTAVRAAEDGVVAYSGNELKGYGNLILIRHSNGFVTAYAHASEIMVKRNDKVRRGQVIAKSGQTGTVASPQLHFEIRKGSSPVDPMQHLPSGA
jgi:murein DD-endopeptidase MepM/ murein hydrolase activator NlpD